MAIWKCGLKREKSTTGRYIKTFKENFFDCFLCSAVIVELIYKICAESVGDGEWEREVTRHQQPIFELL